MSRYKDINVLVTGGSGFIGSRLSEVLRYEEFANVNVLVHNWNKASWVSRSDVNLFLGDITNSDDLDLAIKDCQIVFHCVGIGGTLEECLKINLGGTKVLLDSCLKNNIKKIIYFSSVVVHGPNIYDGLNEQSDFIDYNNPYAISKIESEKYFNEFTKMHGIDGVVIRPTFVWGPLSQYYTIDIVKSIQNNNLLLVNNGNGIANTVYIDNLIEFALVCGADKNAIGKSFIITDNERITWKDFYEYYGKMLKINISEFKSINSKINIIELLAIFIRTNCIKFIDYLSLTIYKDNSLPILVTILKIIRKPLKLFLKLINSFFLVFDRWDRISYSSKGFIDISTSLNELDYVKKNNISEGMAITEFWLKDQNYIN
jgi:nucleoside-diphosphate-sugar epimerase